MREKLSLVHWNSSRHGCDGLEVVPAELFSIPALLGHGFAIWMGNSLDILASR